MSKTVDKQWLHAQRVALLIQYAAQNGYKLTGGDWYRDSRCNYGSSRSKHRERLATDFNLFKINEQGHDVYMRDTKDHEPLGIFWESLGGTWGGRFSNPDGNHYQTD